MPLEVVWSPLALARLQEIRAFISLDQPHAAERLAIRIVAIAETLRLHPFLGRVVTPTKYRELLIGGTPYAILYTLHKTRIVIGAINHAAQTK